MNWSKLSIEINYSDFLSQTKNFESLITNISFWPLNRFRTLLGVHGGDSVCKVHEANHASRNHPVQVSIEYFCYLYHIVFLSLFSIFYAWRKVEYIFKRVSCFIQLSSPLNSSKAGAHLGLGQDLFTRKIRLTLKNCLFCPLNNFSQKTFVGRKYDTFWATSSRCLKVFTSFMITFLT